MEDKIAAEISEHPGRNIAINIETDEELIAAFSPEVFSSGRFKRAHEGEIIYPFSRKVAIKEFHKKDTDSSSTMAITKQPGKQESKMFISPTLNLVHMDIKVTKEAGILAKKFNEKLEKLQMATFILFRDLYILKVRHITKENKSSMLKLEDLVIADSYIYGQYTKWTSNSGAIEPNAGEVLPAFSHWTWVESNKEKLVCDLQGVFDGRKYWLTDPAIVSPNHQYGCTDIGTLGINNFFLKHQCSELCKLLQIDKNRLHESELLPLLHLSKKDSRYKEEVKVMAANIDLSTQKKLTTIVEVAAVL